MCRLDEVVDDFSGIGFLKIDTQGFEFEVLEGEKNLSRWDFILLEASLVDCYDGAVGYLKICDYLFGRGFVLVDVDPVFRSRDSVLLQADFLFRRV